MCLLKTNLFVVFILHNFNNPKSHAATQTTSKPKPKNEEVSYGYPSSLVFPLFLETYVRCEAFIRPQTCIHIRETNTFF